MCAPHRDHATRALPAPTWSSQTRLGIPEPAERVIRDRERGLFLADPPKEMPDKLEVPVRAEPTPLGLSFGFPIGGLSVLFLLPLPQSGEGWGGGNLHLDVSLPRSNPSSG